MIGKQTVCQKFFLLDLLLIFFIIINKSTNTQLHKFDTIFVNVSFFLLSPSPSTQTDEGRMPTGFHTFSNCFFHFKCKHSQWFKENSFVSQLSIWSCLKFCLPLLLQMTSLFQQSNAPFQRSYTFRGQTCAVDHLRLPCTAELEVVVVEQRATRGGGPWRAAGDDASGEARALTHYQVGLPRNYPPRNDQMRHWGGWGKAGTKQKTAHRKFQCVWYKHKVMHMIAV